MDRFRPAALAILLGSLPLAAAEADVLLVDSMQAAPAVNTPGNGMSMDAVRQSFGKPVREYPAVSTSGDPLHPPITRWDYGSYSVFFENDLVLHSVVHRGGKQ